MSKKKEDWQDVVGAGVIIAWLMLLTAGVAVNFVSGIEGEPTDGDVRWTKNEQLQAYDDDVWNEWRCINPWIARNCYRANGPDLVKLVERLNKRTILDIGELRLRLLCHEIGGHQFEYIDKNDTPPSPIHYLYKCKRCKFLVSRPIEMLTTEDIKALQTLGVIEEINK